MTLVSEFAARLRARTDLEVRGALSEAAAQRSARRDSAWVFLLADDSRPSDVVGLVRQVVDVEIGVLLRARNRRDDRGEGAATEIEAARSEVRRAVLGWQPDSAWGRVEHRRGRLQPAARKEEQWWLDVWHVTELREQEVEQE